MQQDPLDVVLTSVDIETSQTINGDTVALASAGTSREYGLAGQVLVPVNELHELNIDSANTIGQMGNAEEEMDPAHDTLPSQFSGAPTPLTNKRQRRSEESALRRKILQLQAKKLEMEIELMKKKGELEVQILQQQLDRERHPAESEMEEAERGKTRGWRHLAETEMEKVEKKKKNQRQEWRGSTMFDKRCCRLFCGLVLIVAAGFAIWELSGCPGPPNHHLPSPNYLPILPSNITTAPAPYPINILPLDDPSTLIDLKEFSFLSKSSCNATPFIAVIVHSAPNNTYNRRMIRTTWGNSLDLVFMVGETNSTSIQTVLDDEIKEYNDIVQGSFMDSYRNMTYKHVMGLKWATYHCPGAKYILKTDDDVFVNTPFLQEFLSTEISPLGARKLLLCSVINSAIVKRSYRSKWRVTPQEYPGRWYPRYCTGWAVVYSPDVAFKLYVEAQKSPYFWIDDVHVTGTLVAKTTITHTSLGSLAMLEDDTKALIDSQKSKLDFLFSLSSPKYFKCLWDMVNDLASAVF